MLVREPSHGWGTVLDAADPQEVHVLLDPAGHPFCLYWTSRSPRMGAPGSPKRGAPQ
jgi:hypothetical protein